jgi:hypothetical protein
MFFPKEISLVRRYTIDEIDNLIAGIRAVIEILVVLGKTLEVQGSQSLGETGDNELPFLVRHMDARFPMNNLLEELKFLSGKVKRLCDQV